MTRSRATPAADDPDDRLVVRAEAAKTIGCSESKLRRLEHRGELLPARVVHGVHWHSIKRLLAYKAAQVNPTVESVDAVDGDLAAEAFAAFDGGATGADIVRSLRVAPKVARGLQAEYADLANQIVISGIDAVKLREIVSWRDDEHPLRNGNDLVRFIEALDSPACLHCGRTSKFCIYCFHMRPARAREIAAREVAKAEAARKVEQKRQAERQALREALEAASPTEAMGLWSAERSRGDASHAVPRANPDGTAVPRSTDEATRGQARAHR